VEEGYRTMWEKYCSGQQGQPGGTTQRKAFEPA
jgi:hypothetical protein